MVKRILQITLLIVLPFLLNAQINIMKHYTVEKGLANNEVYHVIQDSKGYMWFATNAGPCKYDGYSFTNYNIIDGISDNTTLALYEDYKGRIWFISISCKLNYFYNDSIYKYEYNDKIIESLSGSYLPIKNSFYVDSLDNVYLGISHKGIYKISKKGEIEIINQTTDKKLKNFVRYYDNETSIRYFSPYNDSIEIYNNDTPKTITNIPGLAIPDIAISFIKKHPYDNGYFLSSKNNFYSFYKDKIESHKFKNRIIYFDIDKNNNIWLGQSQNGIEKYSNADITKKTNHYLKGKSVSSFCIDRENGTWFTTLYSGVYYLPKEQITSYKKNNGIPFSAVNTLEKNNNDLLIGSNKNTLF
ncbi:MAG: two-component regulator propeller domain-containing protein, partial [Bacteroidota bacterium]|nr:two-component regulator propeller domain-containing protein [Bacteroidota bacterium]